ncbi:MAG: CcoQ/FixQ family Cbb3-type cytochrome c oxidase assembly chaperone [Acidobacteria bacterium]|nr:MAG: CcoQ/FixQ family Cbb3-type cytochrome c oxidase assembly chaperone [Acidobacteriota bacterium]
MPFAQAGSPFHGFNVTLDVALLLFFFAFFLAVVIRVVTRGRGAYDEVSRLPLAEDDAQPGARRVEGPTDEF